MEAINHECYVSLEVAKLLKEAGFDWLCRGYYDRKVLRFNFVWEHNGKGASTQCSAPTLDVAQRWLREVKGWEAQVAYGFDEEGHKTYVTECGNPKGDLENYIVYFPTYEEALEACIKKALEIILEKVDEE
jgi:hypothetical protein